MARNQVILSDFIISFAWLWSGSLNKFFVCKFLGLGSKPSGEVIENILDLLSMYCFAWLCKTYSGAYNPLSESVLSGAISGNNTRILYTVGSRIPAQALGSIIAVRLITEFLPEIGYEPLLSVGILQGALTEGALTFSIIVISLEAAQSHPNNFFLKTWICSVSKIGLHILGSNVTGGYMNPASAMGWAYVQGSHINKGHIFVHWLAPIGAALLGVWTFRLFIQPKEKAGGKTA
ncbi:PREDICTED: probable aquaporin SIP2-1 [Nelumbo nucifera]|uniref:Aquaporin SIP2-1 n=2 Tax=Nelumbo nucifera TaxID=4432 RepID=A0A822ZI15_NELNU|nr:PREDICTED: probable aquaporin SIP2-1 [Nelumbo nucifera]DAD43105.1 TPA_asm: hypothetical protein HUJ06_001335 [Nelumbo nucifera]